MARKGTLHWPVNDDNLTMLQDYPDLNPTNYTDNLIIPENCSREMLELVGYSEREIQELHAPKKLLPYPCSLMKKKRRYQNLIMEPLIRICNTH